MDYLVEFEVHKKNQEVGKKYYYMLHNPLKPK